MRTDHLRRRAAFTLAVTGVLLGTGLTVPAFAATNSVSGIVFQDLNDNGTQDTGEAPQAGVEVMLKGADVTATAVTGTDGRYTFPIVEAGSYQLGASNTFSLRSEPITVSGTDITQNVPRYVGSVKVVTFDDADRNGLWDAGEEVLSGIEVKVSAGDDEVATVRTSETGEATVMVGRTGVYTVEATAPDGKRITSRTPANVNVVENGGGTANIGVGEARDVELQLFTYKDVDGDGTVDPGDDNHGPVKYTIRPTGDGPAIEGETGPDGKAVISLPEGAYEVTVTPPEGYVATNPKPLKLNAVADGTPLGAFIGITKPAEYQGLVYIDSNHNGTHDADEPLVEGATVVLVGPRDTYEATTDDKGAYHVPGILPDEYKVTVTLPDRYAGQVSSLSYSADEKFAAGQKLEADYFVTGKVASTEPGQMKGRIFIDANENRKFDSGETPLTGTTITLTGADGKVYSTTVDAAGNYSLTGLPAGTYKVTVTVADAYKDRVSNPTYTSTVTIVAGEDTEADYFITRAVPGVGGTTTGGGHSTTPAATNQARSSAPAASTAARASSGRQLARTGVETDAQTGAAFGLIGLGAALMAWRRRRLS